MHMVQLKKLIKEKETVISRSQYKVLQFSWLQKL